MRRVAVTGIGAVTSIGNTWALAGPRLMSRRTAVVRMDDWDCYEGLYTRLAAPVVDFQQPAHMSRKQVRTMGRVALMSVVSAEAALSQAGLKDDPVLRSGAAGVSYGSSTGSPGAITDFARMLIDKSTAGVNATTYIRMMSHTAAVNIGVYFGLTGRVIPTSSACTSGSQGLGFGYEAIRSGRQLIMLAGGAEELCPSEAVVFDTLYATSTLNDQPDRTPRPFDRRRDGLVLGEGACTFVLEDMEHALARGATVLAEIIGFATNSDGCHVTQPNRDTMRRCMELALADAALVPDAVGYINAHGTATEHGDIAESHATGALFGETTPISSLKSYIGHTLGACGAIEAWLSIEMMTAEWFAPTVNLTEVDPRCAQLDYVQGEGRRLSTDVVMTNNFAFGGINTSLLLRRSGAVV